MSELVLPPEQAAIKAGEQLAAQQKPLVSLADTLKDLPDDLGGMLHKQKPPEKPKQDAAPQEKGAAAPDDMPADIARSPKAAENWRSLKQEHAKATKALQDKLAAAEKSLEEARAKSEGGIKPEEWEALKKERDEYSSKLRLHSITQHPEFIEKFDRPLAAQIELGKRIAGESGEMVAKLLQLPESEFRTKQLDEITADMSPVKLAQIGSVISQIEILRGARDEALKQPEEMMKAASLRDRERAEAHRAALTSQFDAAWKDAASGDDAIDLFKEIDGNAEHNAGVKVRREMARAIYFNELDGKDRADAAMWAALAPELIKQSAAQINEIGRLKAEIDGLKSARPKIDGQDSNAAASSQGDPNKPLLDRLADEAFAMGLVK